MKKLLIISLVFLASCKGCELETNHEIRYSPDGKDSVVFMMYYDGQQYNSVYMNYLQFNTLYGEGGYEAVYDYYREHELPDHWRKMYQQYKALK